MNLKIKKHGLEALRSGRYKQGEGFLCQKTDAGEAFCCLGVLSDIVDPDGWGEWNEGCRPHNGHVSVPDTSVLDDAEISESHADNLVLMNDTGYSFESIANYIEETL